jgi:phage-related protein
VVGIDRAKMKLYDCEQEAQDDLVDSGQDDTPLFDKGQNQKYDKFNDIKF